MSKGTVNSPTWPCLLVCMLAVATSSPDSDAATIYPESVLGDFHGGQIYSLTDDQSQFVGGHTWGGSDPFDGFRFIVPTGRQAVVNISHTFSNLSLGEKQAWIWDLSSLPNGTGECTPSTTYSCVAGIPNQNRLVSEIVQSEPGFVNPPNSTFSSLHTVLLASGTYLVNDNLGFDNLGATNTATGRLDYVVSINLTAVPLPAVAPLMGVLLLGLSRFARRTPPGNRASPPDR